MDAKAIFSALDTNNDAKISADELMLGMLERGMEQSVLWPLTLASDFLVCLVCQPRLKPQSPQDISTLFRALDKNGSGDITLEEFEVGYDNFAPLIGTAPPEPEPEIFVHKSFEIKAYPSLVEVQNDASKSCVERVREALDAIAALDGDINACCEVLTEQALRMAEEADARLATNEPRRPLEGLPVLIKANIDLEGSLSTNSMPGLEDWRPENTAPIVTKLIEAGAIPVAKTNMPEAAFGCWGYSPLHGVTKNPFNSKYTTSGSSTGTSAGIAGGMASCGLGSDTGGSLRMPAECCGIVGMRPSRGRYPCEGVVPCNPTHDTPGPMATTVADVAFLDAVLSGTLPLGKLKSDIHSLSL